MDKITGNALIAEFMGIEVLKGYSKHTGKEYLYYNNSKMQDFEALPFYDKDWNFLMPVVEKIETMNYHFDIDQNTCEVFSGVGNFSTVYNTGETKIQVVWETVIQFIQWYNQSTKNNLHEL